jgi:RHS repeat-associated protein
MAGYEVTSRYLNGEGAEKRWSRLIGSFVCALVCSAAVVPARAETGVSEQRVSLPDGPGSLGGIGENAEVEGNAGMMTYRVPIRLPAGFQDMTPELALSYNSGSGASTVGIGWSFELSTIERTSVKGLPAYVEGDRFAANGSSELVRISRGPDQAVYRARYEGAFIRYTWLSIGDGKAGYWKAELPDGRVNYYGADSKGTLVANARVEPVQGGTFRYQLVETVDPFGNRVKYGYVLSGRYPLLDSVSYVFNADQQPRFTARFVYEARPDPLSDAKPGFELILDQRLSAVRVFSGSEQIRGYALEYEDDATSGGLSRLRGILETGRNGVLDPVHLTFAYSRALGGACKTDCAKPFVVDMGRLGGGVDMRTGVATLIDINADSLPDVLDTTNGVHTFYLSVPDSSGRPHFSGSSPSQAASSAFRLGEPGVQVLDVDGNGLSDIISTKTGDVLCNDGSGDWRGSACLSSAALDIELQDDPSTTGESNPLHVRFFDYDGDRRMDLLRTANSASTDVRRATATGYESVAVDPIGAVFDEGTLELADMNGDGLLDPVELLGGGQLRFRLNLGRGKWSDWRARAVTGIGEANLLAAQLQDINGDGLADVVVVAGNTLQYALNRAAAFDPPVTLERGAAEGELPERTADTTVQFADMNGNGSDDVVWISADGHVRFLDLFPVKPNLLARIENGIGMVQEVRYGTALAELARDGSWQTRLINAMNVVKSTDMWVTLTGGEAGQGLHDVEAFSYRDGYYDGVEKQFRGFAHIERSVLGDALDSQEPGVFVTDYDVGIGDVYRAGLSLRSDSFALRADQRVPLRSERFRYADCAVEQVPNSELATKVRHLCLAEHWEVAQERAAPSEWASLQTRLEYDGFGNVSRRSELGVVNRGSPESPSACAPCDDADDVACGDGCAGDERYTESEHIAPGDATGGAWILHKVSREVVYGTRGGPQRETLFYYDGPAFVGLPAGKLSQGRLTRTDGRVDGSTLVSRGRASFDAHGNVSALLDPLGAPEQQSGHRRNYGYDPAFGLNITSVEVLTSDASGPYSLRREYTYESSWNEVSEGTDWMLSRAGAAASSRDSTRFRYDDLGRLARIIRPGDSEDTPTVEYRYELGSPVSQIHILGRSQPGPADSHAIRCLDGRARSVQTLTQLANDRWTSDGFGVLNSRGAIVRRYHPHTLQGDHCPTTAPTGVPFTAYGYDPLERLLTATLPDAELEGGRPSVERSQYEPLRELQLDGEDTAEGSPYANTPIVRHFDGLGRLIAIERAQAGAPAAVTRLRYDSLDNLRGYRDAAGYLRTQEFDLLGRVTVVRDPNAGESRIEYDAADNVVRKQDANGTATRSSYDGVNRLVEHWAEAAREATLTTARYDALDCTSCTGLPGELAELRYPVTSAGQTSQGFDRFGYDARRRLSYEARSLEGHLFETHHDYDGLDRLVRTQYPDGQTLTRGYDSADRLVTMPGVLRSLEYDDATLLSAQLFDNGVRETFGYDVRRWESRHALRDVGDVALFDLSYQRDRAGNVKATTDAAAARPGRIARNERYTYDAWYRVLEASVGEDGALETVSSSYDVIDRLQRRTSSLGAGSRAQHGDLRYEDVHPNAPLSDGLALAYDATGLSTGRRGMQLRWDHDDRLVGVERAGQALASLAYGSDEERVVKDEGGHVVYYVSDEFEVRDGISAVYPRFANTRQARLESNALATTVLPDANADQHIDIADAVLGQKGGASAQLLARLLAASASHALFDPRTAKTFLHSDRLQSLVAATDTAGHLVAEQDFYAFGELRTRTGFVDHHGFTGQELDESTGLTHFRHRYLDVGVGSWIGPDPLFETVDPAKMLALGEATTAYAYVANQWANHRDPYGLYAYKDMHRSKDIRRTFLRRLQGRGKVNFTTDLNAKNVARIPGKSGYYDVTVHGSPQGFGRSHDGGVTITPAQLAKMIKKQGDYLPNTKVRLLACRSGEVGGTAAQELANRLGVKVMAPTTDIRFGRDRFELSNKIDKGKFAFPEYQYGEWRTFKPQKKE